MSTHSEFHDFVQTRLRETFGPPDTTLARDDHWSLKPHAFKPPINVLLNGTDAHPALWVFDPHSKNDSVFYIMIQSKEQVEQVINMLHQRVQHAQSTF